MCCLITILPFSLRFDMLVEGRYEFGFGRGHGWIPLKGSVPVEESRDRYEEALKIVLDALDKERFSYDGKYFTIKDSHIIPRPMPVLSRSTPAISTSTARPPSTKPKR
jgi:alkanesulfonate monooxygenase SsuD/methylene tetrahydromethanopterin reductase-like flavin-dependent oxidoreductase (luciferase family)